MDSLEICFFLKKKINEKFKNLDQEEKTSFYGKCKET